MKVIYITDTHGICQKLIENNKELLTGLDLVFLGGDIYTGEIQYINHLFTVPIVAVHGNHDGVWDYKNTNIFDIHGALVECENGTTITGFQGSSKYKPIQLFGFTQEESIQGSKKLPKADILMSHDGPFGYCGNVNDEAHCGLQGVYDYIEEKKPKTCLFGHHHVNKHFIINDTDCYCVYGLAIIDFNEDGTINKIDVYNENGEKVVINIA